MISVRIMNARHCQPRGPPIQLIAHTRLPWDPTSAYEDVLTQCLQRRPRLRNAFSVALMLGTLALAAPTEDGRRALPVALHPLHPLDVRCCWLLPEPAGRLPLVASRPVWRVPPGVSCAAAPVYAVTDTAAPGMPTAIAEAWTAMPTSRSEDWSTRSSCSAFYCAMPGASSHPTSEECAYRS